MMTKRPPFFLRGASAFVLLASMVASAGCGGGDGPPPVEPVLTSPTAASLRDLDAREGYLLGTLRFTHATDESALTGYVIHFADASGQPLGAAIASPGLEGSEGSFTFTADTVIPVGATHIRLFGTDGTELSTPGFPLPPSDLAARQVIDTFPGEYEWGFPQYLSVHAGRLYFACTIATGTVRLCRLNAAGDDFEVLDEDVEPTSQLASLDDGLYFIGHTSATGNELRRYTDAAGVELVGEIVEGAENGAYLYDNDRVTPFEGALYFGGIDASGHSELFRYVPDTGFEQVSFYAVDSPSVGGLTVFNDRLYYYAFHDANGYRLIWYTPEAGHNLVTDADAFFNEAFETFVVDGTRMYFTAGAHSDGSQDLYWLEGDEVERANATIGSSYASPIVATGGELLLITQTEESVGHEWHRITATGELELLADLNPDGGLDYLFDESHPTPFVLGWDGVFVMVGATSTDSSSYAWQNLELFLWEGTGTPTQVLEIGPSESSVDEFAGWDDAAIENLPGSPTGFVQLGERVYFGATDYVNGHELWVLELL